MSDKHADASHLKLKDKKKNSEECHTWMQSSGFLGYRSEFLSVNKLKIFYFCMKKRCSEMICINDNVIFALLLIRFEYHVNGTIFGVNRVGRIYLRANRLICAKNTENARDRKGVAAL